GGVQVWIGGIGVTQLLEGDAGGGEAVLLEVGARRRPANVAVGPERLEDRQEPRGAVAADAELRRPHEAGLEAQRPRQLDRQVDGELDEQARPARVVRLEARRGAAETRAARRALRHPGPGPWAPRAVPRRPAV